MNIATKRFSPPGGAFSGASSPRSSTETPERGVVWTGDLVAAEALRRRAYLRLARTIGVSWLRVRRAANKKK